MEIEVERYVNLNCPDHGTMAPLRHCINLVYLCDFSFTSRFYTIFKLKIWNLNECIVLVSLFSFCFNFVNSYRFYTVSVPKKCGISKIWKLWNCSL